LGHRPDRPRSGAVEASSPSGVVIAEDSLLNAWDRLLAIAVLYPPDNDRFRRAASEWREVLAALATDDRVELEVGTAFRLAHCGQVHDAGRVERSRLYPILLSIGAEGLSLPRRLADEELHALILRLRELATTAERSRDFVHADPVDLPAGVELHLRSFGDGNRVPIFGEVDGPTEAVVTEQDIGTADDPLGNPHLGADSGLARSMEEKLKASATELHRDLLRSSEGCADPADLEILDLTCEPVDAASPEPESPSPRVETITDESSLFDAAALQARLDDGRPEFSITGGPGGEWVALLVQLLKEERGTLPDDLILNELRAALSDLPDLQSIQVLLSALEDLLNTGDDLRVDRLFPPLIGLLRRHPVLQANLYVELIAGVGMAGQEMLWPHLASALLIGAPELRARFRQDSHGPTPRLALELSERVLPRFEACPALVEGRLDPALFRPRRQAFASLYLMLLRSNRADATGNLLCRAFREQPPAEPHASLLALLGGYRAQHREYYRLLIQVAETPSLSGELDREAAELARQELAQMPQSSRRRPELIQAIAALTPAPPGPVDELLTRIRRQRHLGFLPSWPAAARREADRVVAERAGPSISGGAP
jgi:hypothetical protein